MSSDTLVTLNKGGTKERTVRIDEIQIPDMWHLAMALKDFPTDNMIVDPIACSELVLECWAMAKGLKRHIEEN